MKIGLPLYKVFKYGDFLWGFIQKSREKEVVKNIVSYNDNLLWTNSSATYT